MFPRSRFPLLNLRIGRQAPELKDIRSRIETLIESGLQAVSRRCTAWRSPKQAIDGGVLPRRLISKRSCPIRWIPKSPVGANNKMVVKSWRRRRIPLPRKAYSGPALGGNKMRVGAGRGRWRMIKHPMLHQESFRASLVRGDGSDDQYLFRGRDPMNLIHIDQEFRPRSTLAGSIGGGQQQRCVGARRSRRVPISEALSVALA